eukprot:2092249-Rhodomonas_salina.1
MSDARTAIGYGVRTAIGHGVRTAIGYGVRTAIVYGARTEIGYRAPGAASQPQGGLQRSHLPYPPTHLLYAMPGSLIP